MKRIYTPGLVSIGLPVYNGGAHNKLPRALDSLLNQTYRNIELIISDNASTDDTERICREYAARDRRVRYVRQQKNVGLISNTQFVMEEARGEYFMLGSDDDWWRPQFIERLKGVLDANPSYSLVMCSVQNVSLSGEFLGEMLNTGKNDFTHRSYGEVFTMISNRGLVHHILGLYRTRLLHDFLRQPFPMCVRFDRVFLCEVAFATKIYSLPDVLYHKTIYEVSTDKRYHTEYIKVAYQDPKAYSIFIWAVVHRLIRSRNIPLGRKLALYPFYLLSFFWRWRRVLLKEWIKMI